MDNEWFVNKRRIRKTYHCICLVATLLVIIKQTLNGLISVWRYINQHLIRQMIYELIKII